MEEAGYAIRELHDKLVRVQGKYYDEFMSAQLHTLIDEAVDALFIVKEELL